MQIVAYLMASFCDLHSLFGTKGEQSGGGTIVLCTVFFGGADGGILDLLRGTLLRSIGRPRRIGNNKDKMSENCFLLHTHNRTCVHVSGEKI